MLKIHSALLLYSFYAGFQNSRSIFLDHDPFVLINAEACLSTRLGVAFETLFTAPFIIIIYSPQYIRVMRSSILRTTLAV